MKKYIGTKLVQARPMTRGAYNRYRGWEIPADENPEDEGYLIQYPDGYVSWSPKGMFDHSYLEVDDNPQLPSGVSIGPGMVEAFIDRIEVMKLGERTTVVRCILKNGFELVESSACVDPRNYSVEIGQEACMEKIRDRIWNLLGFLLQTAWMGVRKDEFYFEPRVIDSSGKLRWYGEVYTGNMLLLHTEETVYIRDNGSKLFIYTLDSDQM